MKNNQHKRYVLKRYLMPFVASFSLLYSMEKNEKQAISPRVTELRANNIDELVLLGIQTIEEKGEIFQARGGRGRQAYDVKYVLRNPLNRVHAIRKPAKQYFCRELLAYFKGSLNVSDGLSQASKVWDELADENNCINSNYGYYVFHQKIPEYDGKTQYQWVIDTLCENLDSRRALVNINQTFHKNSESRDFPCTIGIQFFVRSSALCCDVSSRSTDIYTGLPYDMGFFAFLTELVYTDLAEKLPEKNLILGYVAMTTIFTQIYDKTAPRVGELAKNFQVKNLEYSCDMPKIDNAQATLKDIYEETCDTDVMKWIYTNANFEN